MQKVGSTSKATYEKVKPYVESQRYTLVDDTYDPDQPLHMKCSGNSKGEIHDVYIKYERFRAGTRCRTCTLEKSQIECMEKYGVKYHCLRKHVIEKRKKTCIEKYGLDNPTKSAIIRDKIKNTCLKKFGVENAFQSEEIKEKIKQKLQTDYGVTYNSQRQDVRDKVT